MGATTLQDTRGQVRCNPDCFKLTIPPKIRSFLTRPTNIGIIEIILPLLAVNTDPVESFPPVRSHP